MENEELLKELEELKKENEILKSKIEELSKKPRDNSVEKKQIKMKMKKYVERFNLPQRPLYSKLYAEYGKRNNLDLFDKELRQGKDIFNWLDCYGDMIKLNELVDEMFPLTTDDMNEYLPD